MGCRRPQNGVTQMGSGSSSGSRNSFARPSLGWAVQHTNLGNVPSTPTRASSRTNNICMPTSMQVHPRTCKGSHVRGVVLKGAHEAAWALRPAHALQVQSSYLQEAGRWCSRVTVRWHCGLHCGALWRDRWDLLGIPWGYECRRARLGGSGTKRSTCMGQCCYLLLVGPVMPAAFSM